VRAATEGIRGDYNQWALTLPRISAIAVAVIAAATLAILRGLPFLVWPDTAFDSDQAIVGLMAKHLAEGRAFPLYFYGQTYMLGMQAWLAAPLFMIGGASVALLKLPLVLINGAAAGVLVWTLHRYAQLPALAAFAASLLFVLAPPVTGSLLIAAMGGSVEPFLYILLIWLLRERPIWCGVVAGVGFLHREFSVYGVVALLITAAVYQRREWRQLTGHWLVMGVVFLAVLELARVLLPFSDPFGPELAKIQFATGFSNVDAVIARVQCDGGLELWPNVQYLFQTILPALFGTGGKGHNEYFLGPALAGNATVWLLLWAGMLAATVRLGVLLFSRRAVVPPIALFLFLVGMQAAIAYVASCGVRNPTLVRYVFLVLLVPVAVAAAYLRAETRRPLGAAAIALLLSWAGWSVQQYLQIVSSYMAQPPESARAVVARELERRGLHFGYAPYWDAYYITFLTDERVTLASGPPSRILSYHSVVARAPRPVYLQPTPCQGDVIEGMWVCFEEPAASTPPVSPALDIPLPAPQDVTLMWEQLETRYRDLGRAPASSPVDSVGVAVWTLDYLRHRLNACDQAAAIDRVFQRIDGKDGAAPCGSVRELVLPSRDDIHDFARQLERKYRQELGRTPTAIAVDLEDGVWWIAQYVRYRAGGCAHDRALGRVMRQIDGLAVLEGGC
jgi:hypothetical protein